jgi:nucleoside-diphosphate-sugar epimerase
VTGLALVTGGAGSVGRRVVEQLRRLDYTVRVFDLPNLDYSGLEGQPGIEVVRGSITDPASVREAVQGVSAVIHLAALLPPNSERDRERTFAINVEGSVVVAQSLLRQGSNAPLIFSSSVSTYGDTTDQHPPVTVDRPSKSLDVYAESKAQAEKRLREEYPSVTVLRITGISVPSFQEPPGVWPFMRDQRIEFVHRDDVVTALCTAVGSRDARGRTFNIAGGRTWQMLGEKYVADYYGLLGVSLEEALFMDEPGWFDWYDTEDSRRILKYQNTTYETYLQQVKTEVLRLMEG